MIKRTPEGELLTELVLETFQLNGSLLDAGNQITKPYSLTSSRWQVMGAIDLEGRALTVAQIARRMGLTRQAVQRVINDLVKLGMVETMTNLDHKRSPLYSISKTGAATMEKIDKAQAAWINQLSTDLTEKQIKQALNLLRTVKARCEDSIAEFKSEK